MNEFYYNICAFITFIILLIWHSYRRGKLNIYCLAVTFIYLIYVTILQSPFNAFVWPSTLAMCVTYTGLTLIGCFWFRGECVVTRCEVYSSFVYLHKLDSIQTRTFCALLIIYFKPWKVILNRVLHLCYM